MNRISCLDCQFKSSCFQILTKEELEYIDNHRVEINYKKGEIFCKQGSKASHIMYIKKGLAKIYIENPIKNLILRIIPEGHLIGLPSISNNIFTYSVMCYEDSTVCHIDIEVFKEMMLNNPKFTYEVVNILNEDILLSYARTLCLTQNQLAGRMANILKCFVERIYNTTEFELPLSRKDLAELTNMSIESVTRILKEFREDKLLAISGKRYKILDMKQLERICETG